MARRETAATGHCHHLSLIIVPIDHWASYVFILSHFVASCSSGTWAFNHGKSPGGNGWLSQTRTAVPYFPACSLPLSSIFVWFFNSSQRLTTPTSGARFTRMTSVEDAIQEYASTSHPALVFGGFVIMRPALAHFPTTSELIALRQPLIKTNGFKAPFYHAPH